MSNIPYIVEERPDTGLNNSKLGIWIFLASEVMLFGGLFSAYVFLRIAATGHPDGDFDFNVIIRTILYNSTKKYLSASVGGAITAKSDPESEYQECLIKMSPIRQVLNNYA